VIAVLEGRAEEQEALLQKVVEIDSAHADALAALGERALEGGDDAAAGRFFDRALEHQHAHLAALLGKGALSSRAGDWKSAEGFFDRAVNVQPDYPFAYIDRGKARQALDDTAGALQDFSRAIALSPDYPWSYIDRAKLFLRRAERREAIADLSIAITLDPGQFESYALRAAARAGTGDTDGALADWERVVSLQPRYWYAYGPLAALRWTRGEWAKARAAFLRAYEFEEDEHSFALCAALCSIRQGRRGDAAVTLQQVLNNVPEESWYRDVARFLLDPNTETALLSRINRERSSALKARMLFYVAVAYLGGTLDGAGRTYLVQIAGRGSPLAIETQLADIELQRDGKAKGR
jgi:tetratricopeptide (TPR) repeat protein